MIELRMRCLANLLVLLAAVPQASAQTASSGAPASHAAGRQAEKSGNRASRAASQTSSPGLCFQPGVGWQRNLTQQHDELAARERLSGDARQSSAKHVHATECPGMWTDKSAAGAGGGNITHLHPRSTTTSASATRPGSVPSFQANTLFQATEGAGLSGGKHSWSEGGLDEPSDPGYDRKFHAYTSSIKLRRSIRNAPDFRTRSALQQLQNNAATQLRRATVEAKTGPGAKTSRQGERARPTSSRKPDVHGQSFQGLDNR